MVEPLSVCAVKLGARSPSLSIRCKLIEPVDPALLVATTIGGQDADEAESADDAVLRKLFAVPRDLRFLRHLRSVFLNAGGLHSDRPGQTHARYSQDGSSS